MPNKKVTTPTCLTCGKKLAPAFQTKSVVDPPYHLKTGILYFGKPMAQSCFCSDLCGRNLGIYLVNEPLRAIKAFKLKRVKQLQDCVRGCEERRYPESAEQFKKLLDEFLDRGL